MAEAEAVAEGEELMEAVALRTEVPDCEGLLLLVREGEGDPVGERVAV